MRWDEWGRLVFLGVVFGLPALLAVFWAAEQPPAEDPVRKALRVLVEEIGRMQHGDGDG